MTIGIFSYLKCLVRSAWTNDWYQNSAEILKNHFVDYFVITFRIMVIFVILIKVFAKLKSFLLGKTFRIHRYNILVSLTYQNQSIYVYLGSTNT